VFSAAPHRWRRPGVMIAMIAIVAGVGFIANCHRRPNHGSTGGPSSCAICPPTSLHPAPPACNKAKAARLAPAVTTPGGGDIDMPHNGLSPTALVDQAALLDQLEATTLDPNALINDPVWAGRLSKPGAADLMEYVVSCALDPCDAVAIPASPVLASWRARFPDGFPGALGLCPSGDLKRPECWQRVSSCVVARVNAVDARVTISMRGDGMTLRPQVPVEPEFRENHGTPIRSFARCDQLCLWGDPLRRNCDWQPRLVGQCVHGADGATGHKVRLQLAAGASGRIRVCDGLYGCDDVDPAPGAGAATAPVFSHGQLVTFPPAYGGHMLGQALGPAVEFACPANGPLIPGTTTRTGYYAVMVGAGDPTSTAAVTTDVALASPPADPAHADFDHYPATEAAVFTYREGGFYGDLGPMRADREPSQLYACASSIWTDAAAVSEDRLCADPTTNCFASQTGQCDLPPTPAPAGASTLCTPTEAPMDQAAYAACKATPPAVATFERPYTVYLSHPCDLFASDAPCEALLERTTCETVARRGGGVTRESCAQHPIARRDRNPGTPVTK
jgi:hypothetical protein